MKSVRKMKVLEVTPETAERWLGTTNTHNRPLRNHLVARYAEAMKRGEWKLTAEPVAFSRPYVDAAGVQLKETLINGQHRLWAVIESGKTVEMTVWWGCEPDEFEVIDQGATRTMGDVLATTRKDLADHTLIAGVCTSFAQYGLSLRASGGTSLRQAHVNVMLRHIEPEILAVVEFKKRLRKLAPRPVVSALLFSHIINAGMTELIVGQLRDAVGFTERDPIRALHIYLTEQLSPTSRDTLDAVHHKTCHAICARLRGEHLRHLRIGSADLGWMREATRAKLRPVVESIHSERVPTHFYNPKLIIDKK